MTNQDQPRQQDKGDPVNRLQEGDMSDDAVRVHLDAAKRGATFLMIYAPGELEASRAMNVVRRVPFSFAHRDHRFAIEEPK